MDGEEKRGLGNRGKGRDGWIGAVVMIIQWG